MKVVADSVDERASDDDAVRMGCDIRYMGSCGNSESNSNGERRVLSDTSDGVGNATCD